MLRILGWVAVLALSTQAAELAATKEVSYQTVRYQRAIPIFDKGYLFFLEQNCDLEVFKPSGERAFRQRLQPPEGGSCSVVSAAANQDGTFAVTVGFMGAKGRAHGIARLDAAGGQTSFNHTDRFLPSHICFDQDQTIWAFGWQRDPVTRDGEDHSNYRTVRQYSRDGKEIGAYLPRFLWAHPDDRPGAAVGGFWHIVSARDRVAALTHENYANRLPELIEWDRQGTLLNRYTLPRRSNGGRAYTADGRFFTRRWDGEGKRWEILELDRQTGQLKPVSMPQPERGLLLGADGEDLVFDAGDPGWHRLLWIRPPKP